MKLKYESNGRVKAEEGDVVIDIFQESMTDYLDKLNAASKGRYELDDYDMQVLSVALDQYAENVGALV